MSEAPFFIGWARAPAPLARFLRGVALGVVAGGAALGLGLGFAADDPAGPGFARGVAVLPELAFADRLEGVLVAEPYPVLHLPGARAVLLADEGKLGAFRAVPLAGQRVAMGGYLLRRGDIEMLVSEAVPESLGTGSVPAVERLGRWRITGEVCDGKCAGGAMRPGVGMAHRACATLCIEGGLPAVFVATAPVAGSPYLLLADAEGRAAPAALAPLIGLRVRLEGEVVRQGGMLIFRADLARAAVN